MIKIYHNPRCKKSRAGLAYLQTKTEEFETILYLKDNLTKEQLGDLIEKTGLKPEQLIRKQEEYYKKNLKGVELTKVKLIDELIKEPKLLVRPIVEINNSAVLADPPENLDKII